MQYNSLISCIKSRAADFYAIISFSEFNFRCLDTKIYLLFKSCKETSFDKFDSALNKVKF